MFYELGLAHAIGKPVILVAGQDDSIPFDIGHLRHARYNKNHPNWGSLLEEELVKALGEVLQSPEKAIPREFAPSQKHAYLLNAATGNALDVDVQTASSEGGKVIQFPLHGRLNQRWRLQPVAPDTYLIVSVMTSRVVSIFGEITEGAQRITQCEHQPGNPAQEWVMDFRHDDGSCMLRNKHTGQYLAVDGIDQHNLDVFQYPWREGLEQRWFPLVVT